MATIFSGLENVLLKNQIQQKGFEQQIKQASNKRKQIGSENFENRKTCIYLGE